MKNHFSFTYKFKGKEINIKKNFPLSKDLVFLRHTYFSLHRDLYSLACVIFILEKLIKKNRFIDEVIIPISPKNYKKININSIESELHKLLMNILHSDIKITLKSEKIDFSKTKQKFNFEKMDAICLFSGGVDSFSGLLNAKKQFKKITPLFIAHSDQQGMISIVNKINNELFRKKDLTIKTLHAPAIKKGGYSQLRGFLYFTLAGLYANLSKCRNIIITECGPTMYQPRFAPMDEITFTTHPKVLNATKKILQEFIGKINLIIPFENLTKAEVISLSPDKDNFDKTHSCISQRNRNHDGTCYGCVIRKLGSLVSGVSDVHYNYNILSNDDNPKKSDSFVSLLNACYDILFNYKGLPSFTKENIEVYNKKDLFKRFALDNFSALYVYYTVRGHNKSKFILDLYRKALSNLGEEVFKKRINDVRSNKLQPDFKKVII